MEIKIGEMEDRFAFMQIPLRASNFEHITLISKSILLIAIRDLNKNSVLLCVKKLSNSHYELAKNTSSDPLQAAIFAVHAIQRHHRPG